MTATAPATDAGAASVPSFEAYYYAVDDSSQQTSAYRIYKVSPNLGEADVLISSFAIPGTRHRVITDSWKEGTILFVVNGETESTIYSVDVATQDSQPTELATIPVDGSIGESLGDARFIDDGSALAFVTQEGLEARAENSILHVISLEDQEEKETYLLSLKSPLYGGFRFRAATPDTATIYVDEIGGDGPMVWSQWYRVDRRSQTVHPLEDLPPMAIHGYRPVTFAFSPDRSKLAYANFSIVVEDSDLELPGSADGGMPGSCLRSDPDALGKYEAEGGTISIRDLETGSTSEVFRNLAYSNNYCKNLARRIVSLKWLDDSRLAFETIDGVYALDIDTRQVEPLFLFHRTLSTGEARPPAIQSIQLPFILFSDHSLSRIDTAKWLELVSPEAFEGTFFTFD